MVKNDTCWVLKGSWGLTKQGHRKETQRRQSLEESTYSIIQKTERMRVISDLCHVLSLPLILMLSASFSQLQYKMRLLSSFILVRTIEFLKFSLRNSGLPLMTRKSCHSTVWSASLETSLQLPLLFPTWSSWKMPFYKFKFFQWLEFSRVLV